MAWEGEVEIEEFINDEYVAGITVISSVLVEDATPLQLLEDRLLESTLDSLRRAAGLSSADLRSGLDNTKKTKIRRIKQNKEDCNDRKTTS